MILIFSYADEVSTDLVIDWLNYYEHPYVRINPYDLYGKRTWAAVNHSLFHINGTPIPFNEVNAVWFRKFSFQEGSDLEQLTDKEGKRYLIKERQTIFNYLLFLLDKKKWLTHHSKASPNKCILLSKAQQVGLAIPTTHIVNNTQDGIYITADNHSYIYKPIDGGFVLNTYEGAYTMYTKEFDKKIFDYDELPSVFGPSLIQENIEKEYEVRTFYLCGKLYSMAIFSQDDDLTKVDFRNYNRECPNRNVPYQLPDSVEKKIDLLMQEIGLNCGSLDLIKSTDGEYYFLEVNPVGQFGMVDFPCNYGLHEKVALELIKMDTIA